MATTTVSYDKVSLAVDPAGGTTFAHPCSINGEKSVQFVLNLSEDIIPDCENPTNPAQIFRQADTIDMTISGSGKVHQNDVKTYVDLLAAGTSIPAKIRIGTIDATGAIEVSCNVYVTGFSVTTSRPTTAEVDISFAADGFEATDVAAYVTPE
jgi:hypothetical protein